MGKPPTMKTACLIVLISIASCVGCYPSKPLNERSTELAWQAWLLVDQSNRQGDLSLTRRKITPKSVFIAPQFTIDSLPACAEGYKSDPKGRCVRIIKLNESNHLDFLVASLSDRFPNMEEQTEEVSTPGPLQVNIPLEGDDGANETVAIVVTPSSIRDRSTTVKMDVKRLTGDKFDVEDIAAILRVKPESVEMTTIAELSTTVTTMRGEEETTTTTETMTTTTEMGETSTMPLEGDAIFFQVRV